MRIIERGTTPAARVTRVTCSCASVLEVNEGEWKKGTYGGERIVKCAVCGAEIVQPGTEYRGDF